MRKTLTVLSLALASLFAGQAMADDHVVSSAAAQQRLQEASAARDRGLATLDRALASPEVSPRGGHRGRRHRPRCGRPCRPCPTPSSPTSPSARRRSTTDPVAGLDSDIRTLLIIFLIVAIVILVLQAVD